MTRATVGRLESINVSPGGVPKTSVFEALVTETGLSRDRQADRRYHGGPDRAVVLYSLDVIEALQLEGHPIHVGSTGENLTIAGLDWPRIVPGVELQVGAVRLHVTKYATPCANIRGSFLDGDFTRISHTLHPGWSRICARVVSGGVVRPHDPVETVSVDRR
jgi:MOSC domain-containing protein YiiM